MGSFNITCFASNQTIARRDTCRVLPILQSSSYNPVQLSRGDQAAQLYGIANSSSYASCFWQPVGGFIECTYDDYGRVNLELDEASRFEVFQTLNFLLTQGWVTAQGENKDHEKAFDFPEFLGKNAQGLGAELASRSPNLMRVTDGSLDAEMRVCWAYVWEATFDLRIFASRHSNPTQFQFAVLHEETYQVLVESIASATTYENESMAPAALIKRTLVECKRRFDAFVAKNGPQESYTLGFRMADSIRDMLSHSAGQSCHLGSVTYSAILELCIELAEARLSEEEFVEQMTPFVEGQYAIGGLNAMELRITPMVSAGQEGFNEIGQEYLAFVAKVCPRVVRARQVSMYGDFHAYFAVAETEEQFAAFQAQIGEWDGAIADVRMEAVDGKIHVNFSCTHPLDDLREVLEDTADDEVSLASLATALVLCEPAPAVQGHETPA